MEKGFVCFYYEDGRTESVPANSLSGKTAAEIENGKNNGLLLFIRTPRFQRKLLANEKPLELFPQLVIDQKPEPYLKVPFMLSYKSQNNKNQYFISISPRCQTLNNLPPFYAHFDNDQIQKMEYNAFLSEIVKQYGFQVEAPILAFPDFDIDENQSATTKDVVEHAKEEELILRFNANEELTKAVKKRLNIINEIIFTEKKYLDDLKVILDVWRPKLQDKLIKDESDLLFKNIDPILQCQNTFYESIKDCGSKYSATIAPQFISFAPFFNISQTYISSYPQIQKLMGRLKQKGNIKKILASTQTELDGKDIMSYLITPIQRMPRYILFMRDLVKATPANHPDYDLIEFAANRIDEVTKKMDVASNAAKTQQMLLDLQTDIKDQYVFMDKQRNLLLELPVDVRDKPNDIKLAEKDTGKSGRILLFNDIVLIVKQGSKTQKLVYDSSAKIFSYINQRPNATSITIDASGKQYSRRLLKNHTKYVIDFKDPKLYSEFFDTYEKHLPALILESQAKMCIKFTNAPLPVDFPTLVDHQLVNIENTLDIYIFSSRSTNVMNNTHTIARKLLINQTPYVKVQLKDLGLPAMRSSRATAISHTICMVSEQNLFVVEPRTNQLSKLKITPPYSARYGSSLVTYKHFLYVFGGKKQDGTCSNDLFMIDPQNGQSELVKADRQAPTPRFDHSAIVYNDKMYIFGGICTKTESSDLYCFNFEDNTWTKVLTNLRPSSNHAVALVEDYMFIIGGSQPLQVVRLSAPSETISLEIFGNVPQNLTKTQAITLPDSNILTIGGLLGREDKGYVSAGWILQVPELFKKGARTSLEGRRTALRPIGGANNHNLIGKTDFDPNTLQSPKKERVLRVPSTTALPISDINYDGDYEEVPEEGHIIEPVTDTESPELPNIEEVQNAHQEQNHEEKGHKEEEEKNEGEEEEEEEEKQEEQKIVKKSTAVKVAVGVASVAIISAAAFFAYKYFAHK